MSALEDFFRQIGIWNAEQGEISKWQMYQADSFDVEEFAHKKMNMDPVARDESGHETAEKILCSKCSPISDNYRFGRDTSDLEYITDALRKYKTSEPIILFRGVCDVPMEKMVEAAKELDEDGIDFYEKGYMSCSLLKEKASPYKYQFVIYVPPFNHVMYAGHCNDEEEPECRYECIIMRGSKLKLLKQEKDTYYCILESTE